MTITPTGQARRKVLFEYGGSDVNDPRVTLQLDVFDNLSLIVTGRLGEKLYSSPAAPGEFALRPALIQFEVYPRADGAFVSHLSVNARQHGPQVLSGDFGGPIANAQQSIGASLEGRDPATFTVHEIVVTKAPLPAEQMKQLQAYFAHKWGLVFNG